jgi:ABC-type phosphate transport system permease subunit
MAFNKLKEVLQNLREKPEEEKRAIILIVIAGVSVVCVLIWLGISYRALNNLTRNELKDQIHLDDFKKEFDKNKFGK